MIEVKGTKSEQQEDQYERYLLKNEEKRSKAPLFFTVLLTGFALYLKTALSGKQQEQQPIDDAVPNIAPEENRVAPPEETSNAIAFNDEWEPLPSKKTGGVRETDFHNRVGYAVDETPSIDFQQLHLPSSALLRRFGGISVSFHASNDNTWSTFPPDRQHHAKPDPRRNNISSSERNAPPSEAAVRPDSRQTNRAPQVTGPVSLLDVSGCTVALIGLADLLRGAWDLDGDPLSIRNLTVSSGSIVQTSGGWAYSPAALGPVTITYIITDGQLSVLQTAQFSVVKPPPIVGSDGDDNLLGTACADEIDGRGGNDNIDARAGNDTVNGGDGNDNIVGGLGNDVIFAGLGNDTVFGGLGDDQIWGGAGNDRLFGDDGRDILFGDAGDDLISGGLGNDIMFGGDGDDRLLGDDGDDALNGEAGNDALEGGNGNDVVFGHAGQDVLKGGGGNDLLSGGAGADDVDGGNGNDTVVGDADQSADRYDGGSEIDTLDYSALMQAIDIDLGAGSVSSAEAGDDQISNFEVIRAGSGDDEVTGSDRAEEIHGNDGDDVLAGLGNADSVSGGNGNDTVVGDLDGANDRYEGGAGIDTLDYSSAMVSVFVDLVAANATGAEIGTDMVRGFEVIRTGAGDDRLVGSGDADILDAGFGSDTVCGGAGDDVVLASADSADDCYTGGEGFDTLDYSQAGHGVLINLQTGAATGFDVGRDIIDGFEKVVGGAGNDVVTIGGTAVTLTGGGGDDTFQFHVAPGTTSADVVHQILDFMVGDRIETSRYDIFEEVIDSLEDRFEDVYGEQGDIEDLPIRIRHEGTDELGKTFVEVDMDRDQHFEMTISLSGHHVLMIVENAAA
ncbi:cadherin-like domain-containing protein [Rhizobium sp. Root1220]|uniref:cadherin-like domain-containing protein n=1 Tax=Rhizobium sp. Root1220 TaxID=1736432 RepID=UPI0006F21D02|nr:cadherin-like domain-containing protein [Rhizobium sp. Root1220]KQV70344.1 hypothetical protein ASC90_09545 [Rhizobium sp. Root1220]